MAVSSEAFRRRVRDWTNSSPVKTGCVPKDIEGRQLLMASETVNNVPVPEIIVKSSPAQRVASRL